MADTELTQYLQFQGQEAQTGCIIVHSSKDGLGRIFMHHGNIVYAETKNSRGLVAFFTILTWKDVTLEWGPDQFVSTIAFNEPVDMLLFQFAQLEDAGQTDEISLVTLFHGTGNTPDEINLTELKHYLITFEILNAEFNGMTFTLEKDITLIGRSDDCDVVVQDATVTSHHCTIAQEANCVRVSDLGSTNGTFINGRMISNAILQVGDDLFLGQVGMRMSMKMQRKLALASDLPASQSDESHRESTAVSARKTQTNIDVDAVRQRVMKEAPKHPHEAITWKTVEESSKPKIGGIFGKMFKK